MPAAVVLAAMLTAALPASAEQVIFVVRHAERAPLPGQSGAAVQGMMGEDPPLNAAGEQRAAKLASVLASAGIRHIYTSEYRRTRQTADPLAKQLELTPVIAAAKDPDPLIAQVRRAQGNVLIVGHANTMPDLLKKLGVTEAVTIGDNDYDNLFIVFRNAAGKATLVRLKY
jgi:broad specificity phosphatase PhoE